MRIAMTGATGLLGRNVLFELLKSHRGRMDDLQVFLLGRPSQGRGLRQRVVEILGQELADYFGGPVSAPEMGAIQRAIRTVEIDLDRDLEGRDGRALLGDELDIFLHVAAMTNFSNSARIAAQLQRTNVEGSRRLMRLLNPVRIRTLGYVGTAYIARRGGGHASPRAIDLEQEFRNPYEESKAKSESEWRAYAAARDIPLQVFRPSTVCGRLLEGQLGATCKFDVFYGWAKWFLHTKLQRLGPSNGARKSKATLDIRVHVAPGYGLNFVAADYAAKLMVGTLARGGSADVNVVADRDVPHEQYIPWILTAVGVEGVRLVSAPPTDLNRDERVYYRIFGSTFGPYITEPSTEFDLSSRRALDGELGLSCPRIDRRTFDILMGFAVDKNFGLPTAPEATSPRPRKGGRRPSPKRTTCSVAPA